MSDCKVGDTITDDKYPTDEELSRIIPKCLKIKFGQAIGCKIQGFYESFNLVCNYKKESGNSATVPFLFNPSGVLTCTF